MTEAADRGGRYGAVHESFWTSPTTGSLSDDGKLLALYLMTCGHNTIAGVLRLPDGYASADLGWDIERVRGAFAELERAGFARRCQSTSWVWIVRHFRWNPPANPNQRKAIRRVAHSIPDVCAWLAEFWVVVEDVTGYPRPAEPARSETLPDEGARSPGGTGADDHAGQSAGIDSVAAGGDAPPGDDGNSEPAPAPKGTAYGLIAGAIRRAGLASVSSWQPEFRALVDAGATVEEFVSFVPEALKKDKPFPYLIASVAGARKRAKEMSDRIRHGPMPTAAAPPDEDFMTRARAAAGLPTRRPETDDNTIEMPA